MLAVSFGKLGLGGEIEAGRLDSCTLGLYWLVPGGSCLTLGILDQLSSPIQDYSECADIDCDSGDNDDPDWSIEGRDAEEVPIEADPAPELVDLR